MPSAGQTPIPFEVAEDIAVIIEEAIKHGLLVEWLAYFIGGLKEGQEPFQAAHRAAYEWDI
jgi:hypothetical protein